MEGYSASSVMLIIGQGCYTNEFVLEGGSGEDV